MKPENRFTARVEKHLPPKEVFYRLKNNHSFEGGVFDKWYSGDKADIWIEYKYEPTLPVRRNITPALSELQKEWGRKRHAEGRRVFVIVGCQDKGAILTSPTAWERSYTPEEFCYLLKPVEEIAQWIMEQCLCDTATFSPQPKSRTRSTGSRSASRLPVP